MAFERPQDHADYVLKLGFTGVSYSGGEALLTMDRVLAHMAALRQTAGPELYTWLYTNGRRLDDDKLRALAAAGLNEVRINIAAWDYELDAVARAVGHIDRVSVEIPAVPEDIDRLLHVLPGLQAMGVQHLNLHQLMVLGSNAADLGRRGYQLADSHNPPVPLSEVAALEVMVGALDAGITLPVHLCSWAFKARWHVHGPSRRLNELVQRSEEAQTETGLLRRIWIEVQGPDLANVQAALQAANIAPARWRVDDEQGHLYLHPSAQLSSMVQALSSEQLASLSGPLVQPAAGSQASLVQGLSSLHSFSSPGTHLPSAQASPSVQASPSSQLASKLSFLQPATASQLSWVQGLLSSQSSAAPDTQTPSAQLSLSVQASPSLQSPSCAVWPQPFSGSQASWVQALSSLQSVASPARQTPSASHLPSPVQGSSSSHASPSPSSVVSQKPAALHEPGTQGSPESQSSSVLQGVWASAATASLAASSSEMSSSTESIEVSAPISVGSCTRSSPQAASHAAATTRQRTCRDKRSECARTGTDLKMERADILLPLNGPSSARSPSQNARTQPKIDYYP